MAYPPQGQPMAYPYPYPYAPPMAYVPPPVQPGRITFEGLGRLRTATLLAISIGVVSLLLGLWALSVAGQITGGNFGAAFGAIMVIILFAIVVFILGIIGLVFAIWGLSTVHSGREEFGATHAASVKKGVNLIIIGIVIEGVGTVVSFVLGLTAGLTLNPNAVQDSLFTVALVGGGFGLASTVVYAFGMQLLLERLVTVRGRGLRVPFLIAAISGGVGALVLGIAQISMFQGDFNAFGTSSGLQSLAGVASIVSLYLYFMQLKDAEQGARNMIQSGQYDPDAAGPAQAAPAPPA